MLILVTESSCRREDCRKYALFHARSLARASSGSRYRPVSLRGSAAGVRGVRGAEGGGDRVTRGAYKGGGGGGIKASESTY